MSLQLVLSLGFCVMACAVIGLWVALRFDSGEEQDGPDPIAEALDLQMQLREMAHETRVDMIRAAREGWQ